MTDVAQILHVGVNPSSSSNNKKTNNETTAAAAMTSPMSAVAHAHHHQPPSIPSSHQPNRSLKMQGMSREVLDLLVGTNKHQDGRTAELPPSVPTKQLAAATATASATATATATDNTSKALSIKVGNKWISSAKPARPWVWAPFTSSSRTDGLILHHWVRAKVEYPDYPYARFDIHLDPVVYSDEEYQTFLVSEDWTKSETDLLMELARRYELRWPVIHDRWIEAFSDSENNLHQYNDDDNSEQQQQKQQQQKQRRRIEDLQYRYYSVAALLTQSQISQEAALEAKALETAAEAAATATATDPRRTADQLLVETAAARALASSDPLHQPLIANVGTGTSNKVFDWKREKERREQMEELWHRTKTQELEEAEWRKELAQIETQLRKLKKRGAHILAAAAAANAGTAAGTAGGSGMLTSASSAASSQNPSRSVTPVPGAATSSAAAAAAAGDSASLDQAFAATSPTPMPHYPYLQSGRLAPPATGGATGLNRTLLTRMEGVLEELKVPDRPLPTKRVCDLYDSVRRDVLTLLILQKNALQKEGLVQGRRLKLAKMGGNVRVVDEETLMGIAPPKPAATPTPVVRGGTNKASRGTKASKSGAASGISKGKGAARKAGADAAASRTAGSSDGKEPSTATGAAAMTTGTRVAEKKPRKQAVKRKRKTEVSKAPSAAIATASATAGTVGATAPPASATTATTSAAAAPVAKTAVVNTTSEPTIGGKKRARKS